MSFSSLSEKVRELGARSRLRLAFDTSNDQATTTPSFPFLAVSSSLLLVPHL